MSRRIVFGAALALIALMTIAAPASATPPTEVSGEYWLNTSPPTKLAWRPAGNNCILEVDLTYPFTGDLDGDAVFHYRLVSHGPCTAEIPAMPFAHDETLKAVGTFTGRVKDRSGSFDFTYEGRAWPAEPGELALTARIVVLSGTGDLTGLHGVLDVSYIMGEAFDSYSGQIHFDPQP
jgi:hypothetical protein